MSMASRAIVNFFEEQWSTVPQMIPNRKWPETANDPQNGPQMILDRKWSPKSTANDPERKKRNGLDSS